MLGIWFFTINQINRLVKETTLTVSIATLINKLNKIDVSLLGAISLWPNNKFKPKTQYCTDLAT